jgi:hypothetical protein
MEDYKQKAHLKFLKQKKIKFQEDDKVKKEQEEQIRLQEEQKKLQEELLIKKREEDVKKHVYTQSQILIIDDTIKLYETDKTDDNIMLILTIINGCIDNIQTIWTPTDIQNITNLVIGFSNSVDANNIRRPKGIDTIANVKILKESFEMIFKLLNLNIDIQTLDTDKDAEIARKLQEDMRPPPHNKIHKPDFNIDAHEPVFDDHEPDFDAHEPDFDDDDHEPVDIPEDILDEEYARRLQEELNSIKKVKQTKEKPKLSTKYCGLNSDDFINALLKEKI